MIVDKSSPILRLATQIFVE